MEEFWNRNKGIILGVTIAVILLITGLQQLIIGLVLIIACGFIGNYIYKNKDEHIQETKRIIKQLIRQNIKHYSTKEKLDLIRVIVR